jgi:hypothetical protein
LSSSAGARRKRRHADGDLRNLLFRHGLPFVDPQLSRGEQLTGRLSPRSCARRTGAAASQNLFPFFGILFIILVGYKTLGSIVKAGKEMQLRTGYYE